MSKVNGSLKQLQAQAEARRLAEAGGKLILSPQQAKQASHDAHWQEMSNLVQLQETLLIAAITGGSEPTFELVEKCEEVAAECLRRRIQELVAVMQVNDLSAPPHTQFMAKVLGVEIPEPKPQPQPVLVQAPAAG